MAKIVRTWSVEAQGIGFPDYTREVSSALERRGLRLAYKQTLKIFGLVYSNEISPYSWVGAPLAAGVTAHFIDNETGLVAPYTIDAGYILFVIEAAHSSNEDVELWGYVDGFVYTGMGIVSEGQHILDHRVVGFNTAVFDPTGATAHVLDVTVTNVGAGALRGGFTLVCIQEEVGTDPIPTTKTVRCKFCGYEETVPRETTNWICPKCDQLNIYMNLRSFKG